jgi:hypothetical protein
MTTVTKTHGTLGVAMACAIKISETEEEVAFLLTGGVSEELVTLQRAAIGQIVAQVQHYWPVCNPGTPLLPRL